MPAFEKNAFPLVKDTFLCCTFLRIFPRPFKNKNHTDEKEHAKALQIFDANDGAPATISSSDGAKCSFR